MIVEAMRFIKTKSMQLGGEAMMMQQTFFPGTIVLIWADGSGLLGAVHAVE
jgi:hypothetical protein